MRWLGFLILLVSAYPALAQDFKVSLPAEWKQTGNQEGVLIYENVRSHSHETVTLNSFKMEDYNEGAQAALPTQMAVITKLRRYFMRAFGLGDYTAVRARRLKYNDPVFATVDVIQSRFVDAQGREVQMIEREFVAGNVMYVVTYLLDAPALNSPDSEARSTRILDHIKPQYQSTRETASETAVSTGTSEAMATSLPAAASTDVTQPTPINEKKESGEICSGVETDKQWSAKDPPFMVEVTDPTNCIAGVIRNFVGLIKGGATLAWAAMKVAVNPSYRQQVKAMIGTIWAEIKKDPNTFVKRLASEMVNSICTSTKNFFQCLSAKEQVREICSLLSNAIPISLVVKMLFKIPLAVDEMAKVARAVGQLAKDSTKVAIKTLTEDAAAVIAPSEKSIMMSRAQAASEGSMPSLWTRSLSKSQADGLAERLSTDAGMKAEYSRLTQSLADAAKQESTQIPHGLEDQFMTALNRSISNLGKDETLNVGFYDRLVKNALSAPRGSTAAREALDDLRNQTDILRYANSFKGRTLREKLDGMLAFVSLKLKRITKSEADTLEHCMIGNLQSARLQGSREPEIASCWEP